MIGRRGALEADDDVRDWTVQLTGSSSFSGPRAVNTYSSCAHKQRDVYFTARWIRMNTIWYDRRV